MARVYLWTLSFWLLCSVYFSLLQLQLSAPRSTPSSGGSCQGWCDWCLCQGYCLCLASHCVPDDPEKKPISVCTWSVRLSHLALNRHRDLNGLILIFVFFGFNLYALSFWVKFQDVKRLLRNFWASTLKLVLLVSETLIHLFLRAQHWLATDSGSTHIIFMVGAGMTSEQGPNLELTGSQHQGTDAFKL